jgi:hypothetical protein
MTEKLAVSKQVGGFLQHRQRTRPYRVDTLLAREGDRSPSTTFQPEKKYEQALAADEGEEFVADQVKEAAERAKRTCMKKGCDRPATRGVRWADGRGMAICCEKHVGHFKRTLSDSDRVYRYDPDAPKHKRLSPLVMNAEGKAEMERREIHHKLKNTPRKNREERESLLRRLKALRRRRSQKEKISAPTPIGNGEFAPGIPKERAIKSIPSVKEQEGNAEWTASLSRHPAARRGDHLDLRVVDQKGQAHSWAFSEMPEPGKGTYAAQQPTHSKKYALRTKPFTIPLGVYGGTRPGAQVEPKYVQPVEVISASNNRVHLLRHHGQETEELLLKKVSEPPKGSPLWALRNATKTRETKDGGLLPSSKPRYKEVAPDQIDLSDEKQIMTPKLDGAHVLLQFPKTDRMMRVYSYRPTQRKSGLIEHTFKFPGFQNRRTPPSLQGTIVRAELYGTDRHGQAIPASEVGGILNASVQNSRRVQQGEGVKLRLVGLDVVRHQGKDYSDKGFSEKLDILRHVSKKMGNVEELPVARTPEEKKELLSSIKEGRYSMTGEGVVLHDLEGGPPTKAKFRPDHDVYVKDIFTKKTTPKGQAAGFTYSFEPEGPVAGKVGTGFSHQMRKEMAASPEKFVGRVAKVRSAGRHQRRKDKTQGALVGAPAFKEWHIDKTPPELLKESSIDRKGADPQNKAPSTKKGLTPKGVFQRHLSGLPTTLKPIMEFVREERRIKALGRLKDEVGRLKSTWEAADGK